MFCRWFHGNGTCDAFPPGLPDRKYLNLADHWRPYPGDGGIRFASHSGITIDGE